MARVKLPTIGLSATNLAHLLQPKQTIPDILAPPVLSASWKGQQGDVSSQHLVPR